MVLADHILVTVYKILRIMSVRAGLRNPYTEPESDTPHTKTRVSRMLETNYSKLDDSSDDESLYDEEGNFVYRVYNPNREKRKKMKSALANRKDVKLAMKSFKNLLQRTSIRYGIMVRKT